MQLFINIGIIYISWDCQPHFSLLQTFKNQQTWIFLFQKYLSNSFIVYVFIKTQFILSQHLYAAFTFYNIHCPQLTPYGQLILTYIAFRNAHIFLAFLTTVGWFWVWVWPPIFSELCNEADSGNLYGMHSGQTTFFSFSTVSHVWRNEVMKWRCKIEWSPTKWTQQISMRPGPINRISRVGRSLLPFSTLGNCERCRLS